MTAKSIGMLPSLPAPSFIIPREKYRSNRVMEIRLIISRPGNAAPKMRPALGIRFMSKVMRDNRDLGRRLMKLRKDSDVDF